MILDIYKKVNQVNIITLILLILCNNETIHIFLEFIFPEGASKQRGRFELAFSQIGSSVMIGASIGGVAGLYNGIRSTALANQTGKLRRTQ